MNINKKCLILFTFIFLFLLTGCDKLPKNKVNENYIKSELKNHMFKFYGLKSDKYKIELISFDEESDDRNSKFEVEIYPLDTKCEALGKISEDEKNYTIESNCEEKVWKKINNYLNSKNYYLTLDNKEDIDKVAEGINDYIKDKLKILKIFKDGFYFDIYYGRHINVPLKIKDKDVTIDVYYDSEQEKIFAYYEENSLNIKKETSIENYLNILLNGKISKKKKNA